MDKIRTAVIGCGKVADAHAHAYQKIPNSEFAAVCDINPERARKFAEKYGVKAYTNVSEMIAKEGILVTSVCTPHPFHAQNCVEAADAGCNVIVEKPFAVNKKDCEKMIEAGKRNHVWIGTLFQRRFYEPCQRIRKAIDDGKLGKIILGDVTMLGWRSREYYESDPWRGTWKGEGGGVLPTQACHQLDLLLWFMGSQIDEVYGVYRNYNHPFIEVEDTAVAIIKFKNGAVATITASNSQDPAQYGKVRVHGDNGASVGVQTDGGAMFIAGMSSITESPYNDMWSVPGEENMIEQWKKEDADVFFKEDPTEHYHQVQLQDFVNAVAENRKPLVTGEDGIRSAELMEAIYRSSRTGLPVKFPLQEE
ncbi:MAG: Gfo/Idh/MocA family oxidoreductase [Lachnospiraceae bacterium]|nr:Gfo/Idh/MocA family oxidoreductase [Lachnospiraceae bacterium]